MSGIEIQDGAALFHKSWRKKVDAVDDQGQTDEDTPVSLNLFENDRNISGAEIWHIDGQYVRTGGSAQLSSGARVTVGEDGVVTYDPSESDKFNALDSGEHASDSFDYGVIGQNGFDTATVRIAVDGITDDTPGNSPPVAANDIVWIPKLGSEPYPYPEQMEETASASDSMPEEPIFTTLALGEEGNPDPLPESVEIAPLANDKDPDGDTLTIGKINGQEVSAGDVVDLKSGASVTVSQDGKTLLYEGGILDPREPLPLDLADGAYTTTADGGQAELTMPIPLPEPLPYPYLADVFSYQAFDGEAYSNEANVALVQTQVYYTDLIV